MEWTFSYTIDDYLEATRALKKPSRGAKRSHEALWVGLGTGLFALALLLVLGTTTKETSAGYIESSHASTFATILLPTGTLLGFAWAIFVPWTDTVNRGPFRRCLLIMLLSCVLGAGVGALHPPPPSPPAGQGDGVKGTLISLIPFAIMLAGLWVGAFPMLRWARRNAWEGQPQLRLPHTIRLEDEGIKVQHALARHEYKWQAFTEFRETQKLFVLRLSKLEFRMIPKRACRDGAEIEALRHTLEQRIPNAETRRAGFPVVPNSGR